MTDQLIVRRGYIYICKKKFYNKMKNKKNAVLLAQFQNQRYNWNIVESCVKHHKPPTNIK